jgi:hypothetical protein
MHKIVPLIAVLLAVMFPTSCSKGYQAQKYAGDLEITLRADRYPLVKGKNAMTVQVADKAGRLVTDTAVTVKYSMQAMPGMAPMEFNVVPEVRGKSYAFEADIPMEGGWKIDVTVVQPGKPPLSTSYTLDAR